MFSNTNKKSKTFLSLNSTRSSWFKNIIELLRKETISSDNWNEAIELLVATDISYSTALTLVEKAQESYKHKAKLMTASDYLKEAILNHLNNAKAHRTIEIKEKLLVIL